MLGVCLQTVIPTGGLPESVNPTPCLSEPPTMRGASVLCVRFTMLGVYVLLILLWLLVVVFAPPQSMGSVPIDAQQFTDVAVARGYSGYGYNQVGAFPFFPFLEPLVILAGLAFLAFLLQTFHAIYFSHYNLRPVAAAAVSPSLIGGVVDSLVPTRHRTLESEETRIQDILTAIRLYKAMNTKRRNRPSSHDKRHSFPDEGKNETILIPVAMTHFD